MFINTKQSPISTKIIVVGNEKGGTGKSTLLTHIAVALLYAHKSVTCIDLDVRQKTTGRFLQNRDSFNKRHNLQLPMPFYHTLLPTRDDSRSLCQKIDQDNFEALIQSHWGKTHYIVVDTPGNNTFLSALAHSYADILVTPLNDSLIDIDVIARVHPETLGMIAPSHYAEMVFQQKIARAKRTGINRTSDWIVVRNRMGHVNSKNQQKITDILQEMSKRLAFRLGYGFSERVIFKELFLDGLTLLDMKHTKGMAKMSLSHVAARTEIRTLLSELKLGDSVTFAV